MILITTQTTSAVDDDKGDNDDVNNDDDYYSDGCIDGFYVYLHFIKGEKWYEKKEFCKAVIILNLKQILWRLFNMVTSQTCNVSKTAIINRQICIHVLNLMVISNICCPTLNYKSTVW